MTTPPPPTPRGRVAVLGAGPAGMAAALGALQAGHDVVVYERYREARPAGNILNLWPPPLKALRALGVDTDDLGAPTDAEFRNLRGKVRVHVQLDEDVKQAYGGGFIGLLRPELYERMLAAHPAGRDPVRPAGRPDRAGRPGGHAALRRRHAPPSTTCSSAPTASTPWSGARCGATRPSASTGCTSSAASPSPRSPGTAPNMCVAHAQPHRRRAAGRRSGNKGRDGHQWWVLTATDPDAPAPADLKAAATELAAGFPAPLPGLIAATEPENVQRWVLRDRPAAEAVVEGPGHAGRRRRAPDLAVRRLRGRHVDRGRLLPRPAPCAGSTSPTSAAVQRALQSYEDPRKPHTAKQVQMAWMLGKVFHHAPAPLRPVRDFVFDHTPFLQKVAGDSNPREINKQLALIEDEYRRDAHGPGAGTSRPRRGRCAGLFPPRGRPKPGSAISPDVGGRSPPRLSWGSARHSMQRSMRFRNRCLGRLPVRGPDLHRDPAVRRPQPEVGGRQLHPSSPRATPGDSMECRDHPWQWVSRIQFDQASVPTRRAVRANLQSCKFRRSWSRDIGPARAQEASHPDRAPRGRPPAGGRARARARVGRRHRRPGRRLPAHLLQLLPAKDDAVLGLDPDILTQQAEAFLARPADETPVQALRAVAHDQAADMATETELWPLRLRVIDAHPSLLGRLAASFGEAERALAEAIATVPAPGSARTPIRRCWPAWPGWPCAPPCSGGSPATSSPPCPTSSTRPGTC